MDRPLPARTQDDASPALPAPYVPTPPQLMAAPPVELPTLDFLGLFQVIARKKWIILLLLALWVGLALFFVEHSPRIYESHGELEVKSQDPQVRPYQTIEKEDFRSIDALKTVERNLQSTTLIARMIENHGLGESLAGSQAAKIAQIQANSSIQLVKGTRNVSITYRSQDPEFAQRVVNAYIDEFQELEQEDKQRLETALKEGLAKPETVFRQQLKEANQALEDFVEEHAALDLRANGNVVGDKLTDLMNRAAEARAKRIELEKQLGTAASANTASELLRVSSISQLPEIQSLRSSLNEKEAAFDTLKKTFGPKHPDYIAADAELRSFRSHLETAARNALAMLERDFAGAKEAEATFQTELANQQEEVFRREHVFAQYQKLKDHVTHLEKIVNEVTTGIYQTEVNSGLDTHIISVRERPMVSEFPIWPNKPVILAGGLLAGLICGLAMAFALEALRKRIRDQADVAKILPGVTCLTVLPQAKMRTPAERLVLARDPHSLSAEGFRTLRTALHFRRQGEPKIIVVTSANSNDGKSFCAMNCAAAYALQGFQTLLIDGDLRCPSLEPTFLQGSHRGMTDFLRGRAEPHEVCYPTSVTDLYFIPAGDLRPNPSELLAGPGLPELLAKASQFFDKIVIDSAPLVPVSDGLILARHADATCLVVRSNVTTKQDLTHVRELLAKTGHPLAGYILNGAANNRSESSYVSYLSRQQRHQGKTEAARLPSIPVRYQEISDKAAIL